MSPTTRSPLTVVLALGIAAACGPRLVEEGEPTYRRCTPVVGTGLTADGTRRRTDYDQNFNTHELCTCSTDEELWDLSEGGYREYINERGFEMCKELARDAGLVSHDCDELYDQNVFGLAYGPGPGNVVPAPLCTEQDDAAGCQGS